MRATILAWPGSSPRAWGTQLHQHRTRSAGRFIPTGVGNTLAFWWARIGLAVHPHGRGEHLRCAATVRPEHGSSPRAWGTRFYAAQCALVDRFIPTGVGNTARPLPNRQSRSVHPHGRGEHRLALSVAQRLSGSSPRAWGTPNIQPVPAISIRFIPTGVGNTHGFCQRPSGNAVHPHGRGEHITPNDLSSSDTGSSPRAWGTPSTHRCR